MAVELIHFSPDVFVNYLERLLVHYAADKIKAGNVSPQNAEEQIRKEIAQLLPEGLQTPHHTFFEICEPDSGGIAGILWIFYNPDDRRSQAFIYDIEIFDAYRRRGIATQTLLALEDHLRKLGAKRIGLHVFGFNTEAQALYLKLGYEVTNIQMAKQL
jgi:RimJ/RimL family protein N-acetyltransferase